MKLISLAVMMLVTANNASSQTKIINADLEHTFPSGSKSTFSQGWSFDDKTNILVSPENDLRVYFFETELEGDIEKFSLDLWRKINPGFNLKVDQKASPPATDGWEQVHRISYDVPAKESRIVVSVIRVFRGIAYAILADGAAGAFERRGSQFQIAIDSWKPADLKAEKLGERTAKTFTGKEEKEFSDFIVTLAKQLKVPGASIAMVQGGKIVFNKQFGVKALGTTDAVTADTPFMIGSMTKPLTTLMLAKLTDMNKLKWETPVRTILPTFSLADKNAASKLLVKHTACACTGMPRRDLEFIFEIENLKGEDIVRQMSSFKPTTGFGETFQYSNHLVGLGGYIGGAVYSKSSTLLSGYEKAMSDLVFAPIGMTHSFVKPDNEKLLNLPSPHAINLDGKMVPIPQAIDNMVYSVAPAGSVWSTAGDIARYMAVELNNGKSEDGKQIYSAKQIKARRTPGVKVDDTTTYGLGLFLENDRGLEIIGHPGNTLGFTSDMFFLPKDNIGMVVLVNAGSANAFRGILRQKFIEMFYGAEVKSDKEIIYAVERRNDGLKKVKKRMGLKSKDTKWIEKFIGKYKNSDLGTVEIKKTSDGLVLDVGEWSSRIASFSEDSGDKLITLADAPWIGGFEFQVKSHPKKQLVLKSGQQNYDFEEVKEN